MRVCVGRGSCLDMDETESLVSLEFKPPRMRLPCAPIVLSNRTQSYCHTVALPRTEVLAEPEPAPRAHAAYRRWCLDAPATRTLTRMHAPSGTCAGACSVGLVGVGTLAAGVGAAAASARAMPETSLPTVPLTVAAAAAAVFLSRDRRRNETHAQSCAAPCTLRQCVRALARVRSAFVLQWARPGVPIPERAATADGAAAAPRLNVARAVLHLRGLAW